MKEDKAEDEEEVNKQIEGEELELQKWQITKDEVKIETDHVEE